MAKLNHLVLQGRVNMLGSKAMALVKCGQANADSLLRALIVLRIAELGKMTETLNGADCERFWLEHRTPTAGFRPLEQHPGYARRLASRAYQLTPNGERYIAAYLKAGTS